MSLWPTTGALLEQLDTPLLTLTLVHVTLICNDLGLSSEQEGRLRVYWVHPRLLLEGHSPLVGGQGLDEARKVPDHHGVEDGHDDRDALHRHPQRISCLPSASHGPQL